MALVLKNSADLVSLLSHAPLCFPDPNLQEDDATFFEFLKSAEAFKNVS